MAKLLETGKTELLTRFISKRGRPFSAYLVLDEDKKVGFEFEKREAKTKTTRGARGTKEPEPKIDLSGLESIGVCPRCGAPVFETETDFLCEKTQADSKPCKFRSGKVILEQPVDRAQMIKLLQEGRTDLLSQFISKRGRPFSAWLVLDESGKVTFEFPEREE